MSRHAPEPRRRTGPRHFDKLDSGYTVGTAGTKATGRSRTAQLFHGSEVAFWPNARDHFAGVVQAVPDLPRTEIILESTAHGVGGEFYERWQMAEAGEGDHQAIFIPWFWCDDYRREVPFDFALDDDEQRYITLYGLDLEQMAWRRAKIDELRDPLLFKQEYPATAAKAFQFSGHDSFISAEAIMRARKAVCVGIGPLVIGADPARFGEDRFSLAWRRGRKVLKVESRRQVSAVESANWIKQVIDLDKPARVFIDLGGVGAGVYDILDNWGAPYALGHEYAFPLHRPNAGYVMGKETVAWVPGSGRDAPKAAIGSEIANCSQRNPDTLRSCSLCSDSETVTALGGAGSFVRLSRTRCAG